MVGGILLSGFATGDVSLEGERWVLVWLAGIALILGVVLIGLAVYPRIRGAEPGHVRWFAEIQQYGRDKAALAAAVEADASDGARDLHQARALAGIVGRKYRLTQAGMWSLAVGLVSSGLAGLLSAWKGRPWFKSRGSGNRQVAAAEHQHPVQTLAPVATDSTGANLLTVACGTAAVTNVAAGQASSSRETARRALSRCRRGTPDATRGI